MTRYTPLWLQSGSYAASVDRRLVGALWPSARVDGMAVTPATGTTLNIAPGSAAVPTPNATGSSLCVSDAVEQVVLPPAPAAGLNRIDLVIVRPRGNDLDGGVNNDFIFDYVTGAEAATAVTPSNPAGTVVLANVTRPGGQAAIAAGDIFDNRPSGLAIGGAPRPPVAAGAPLASYTAADGQVWVAKGGVNGGAWRLARDVLQYSYGRAAAYTVPASGNATFVYDSKIRDTYGMYNPANGLFNVVVPGWYYFVASVAATPNAAGAWIHVQIQRNSVAYAGGVVHASSTTWMIARTVDIMYCNVGEQVGVFCQANVALTGRTDWYLPLFEAMYVGNG